VGKGTKLGVGIIRVKNGGKYTAAERTKTDERKIREA